MYFDFAVCILVLLYAQFEIIFDLAVKHTILFLRNDFEFCVESLINAHLQRDAIWNVRWHNFTPL